MTSSASTATLVKDGPIYRGPATASIRPQRPRRRRPALAKPRSAAELYGHAVTGQQQPLTLGREVRPRRRTREPATNNQLTSVPAEQQQQIFKSRSSRFPRRCDQPRARVPSGANRRAATAAAASDDVVDAVRSETPTTKPPSFFETVDQQQQNRYRDDHVIVDRERQANRE
ncbi:uncharacterized protein LOC119766100 [Culex quinquefasciatus]|uniref:uncharacterized protein LOC119766100 n=1 Tax=Culex quinquefasciatus TaxID=7176 RepID=UPI0018E34DB9|nr:uncharacterized protein LOC119766100 [Culex quinquefasciatus]